MTALTTVAWLDGLLSKHQIAYWIFGGFAVDFHVGETTRSHDDVDVAVLRADFSRAEALFVIEGWTRLQGDAEGYATFERGGARIDLAPVAGDDVDWPRGAFGDDVLELDGVRARVVSRAALMADKAEIREDASTRAKDAADLHRLSRA